MTGQLINVSTWLGLASDSSKKFCHLEVCGLDFDECALSYIFEVMFFWQRRARKTCRNCKCLRRVKGSVSTQRLKSRTKSDLISLSLSLGAVSSSDVGGPPLFPVSCSFDDLNFTDF